MDPKAAQLCQRVALAAAIIVAALGGICLVGWISGIEALTTFRTGGVRMKANAGLCMTMIGGALFLRLLEQEEEQGGAWWVRRVAQGMACFVAIVGGLTFCEHVFGVDLRIDQLLFTEPPGAFATASPGRMGPPASVSLFWCGIAVAGLRVRLGRHRWSLIPAQIIGAVTAFVGLLAVIGYLYGIVPLYGLLSSTAIAFHSAMALVFLGVGLLLSQRGRGVARVLCADDLGGLMARRFVLPAIFLPITIGYLRTVGQRYGLFDEALGRPVFVVSMILSLLAVVWWNARDLSSAGQARAAAVADQQRVHDALRDSEAHLQLAADIAQLSTFEVNYRTGQIVLSETARAIHGLPSTTSLTLDNFGSGIHPDDRAWVQTAIEDAIGGSGEFAFEHRIIRTDGVTRWLRVRARIEFAPTTDLAVRKPLRNVGTLLDITDEKEAADERERLLFAERSARSEAERLARAADVSAQLADEASRKKDEFLATLSHELRTPLTPVLLTVSMLEADPLFPTVYREDLAVIRKNTELESQLISDLLDLTRIARGKLKLEMEPADLHEVIRESLLISQARDLDPDVERPRVVEELLAARSIVRGDATRLQQIFWNLFNNALKFTADDGKITVRTRQGPDGNTIIAEVIDTGIGIDAAVLPKLFAAFEQGDIRSHRQHAGLGLGLAISREFAIAHGGNVTAQSAGRGQGATFTVELPLLGTEAFVASTDEPKRVPASKVPGASILLVEDHLATLGILSKLLRGGGHRVTGVASMAAALDHAGRERFDLLVSDLGLPDGSGLELLEALGAPYRGRAIAVTGYGMERDIAASREAGFTEHLVKPLDIDVLEAAISRVLNLKA